MKAQATWPMISVSVEREEIPVAMMSPVQVPDEKWRYVDKQGHGHFYNEQGLPTLERVVTGTTWIGDEYEGMEVDITEYRCLQCAEVIKPRTRSEYGPSHIPGPTTITVIINGEEFLLSPEQYAESVEDWREALRKAQRYER